MQESEIELLDLRTTRDLELLKAFNEIYVSAFPIERERESPTTWESLLWEKDVQPPWPILHLLIVGSRLRDPQARTIYGGLTAEFYRKSQCGLLAYLAVKPKRRRQGLAGRLVRQSMETLHTDAASLSGRVRAVFAETHDPRVVPAEHDSILPRTRVRILAKLGARWIDMPYIEPEVNPGHGRTRDMVLLVFPRQGDDRASIGSGIVRAFLHDFYRAHGVDDLSNDPDVRAMEAHLQQPRMTLKNMHALLQRAT